MVKHRLEVIGCSVLLCRRLPSMVHAPFWNTTRYPSRSGVCVVMDQLWKAFHNTPYRIIIVMLHTDALTTPRCRTLFPLNQLVTNSDNPSCRYRPLRFCLSTRGRAVPYKDRNALLFRTNCLFSQG